MSNVQGQSTSSHEEQTNQQSTLVGYPKLARMMSLSSETAIFRRFGELNMLNLLRLQAELHDLEHQLQEIREEDAESKDPVRVGYVNDFRLMKDWVETGDSLQHDLLVGIGKKLEEYNVALLQAKELKGAGTPTKREIEFLQNWLIRPPMGNNFLNDRERTIWDVSNVPDLITLLPRHQEKDMFTSLLNGFLLDLYHRVYGHRRVRPDSPYANENIKIYDEERILALSDVLGATISSLLPTLVILVLYFVHRMLVRIGLVIVFTAIFSLTLSLFTEARKVDVFSATAAFAAVEVVFIGSTNSTS